MRVCIVNDNFHRSSGVPVAIKRISRALASFGVDSYIAGCGNGDLQEDLSWVPDGHYAHFSLKTPNPVLLMRELARFRTWYNTLKIDLVNSHHRRIAALLNMAGLPVVYTAQLVFPSETWFRVLCPRYTTALTASVAHNLQEAAGRKALACISNPVEFPGTLPEIDLGAVRERAVCVARLEPVKGHRNLLATWKLLYDRGYRFRLDLVGEGSLRSELESQVDRDGTGDLIKFHGFTPDVSEFIHQSLFAILVSEFEGQGIVTLEAAAAGRASLLTGVPGSIDLIPPSGQLNNSLVFGDIQQLAVTLEQWFKQPQAVVREGARFFDFLKPSCDPQRVAGQYAEVYRNVLAARRALENRAPELAQLVQSDSGVWKGPRV